MWHRNGIVYNTIDAVRLNNDGIKIPSFVDDAILASLGFITVFIVAEPLVDDLMVAIPDGVEFVSDEYARTKWLIKDRFETYTDANGNLVTKEQQDAEYVANKKSSYVPLYISPVQIRIAMSRLGVRDSVEELVLANSEFKDYWEYSPSFRRDNTKLEEGRIALGWTSLFVDDLFREADKVVI